MPDEKHGDAPLDSLRPLHHPNITSLDYYPPLAAPDMVLATISLSCALFGTPLNLLALRYFRYYTFWFRTIL